MNPYQTTEAVSYSVINGVQDSLAFFDQNAKIHPQLLATMPTVKNGGIKNGGKTYILHLKKGIRWSNGQQLTSKDVKFGWQIYMDKASGPACPAIGCDFIASIATPDAYTDVLNMKQVYAATLTSAILFPIMPSSWPGGWSNDPHAAAVKLFTDSSYNFENTSYPSNGAYQVSSFVANDRVVLKPMKYYDDMNCGPYLKSAIFSFYSDKNAMIAAAAAGNTNVTGFGGGYTAADLPLLKKHTNAYHLVSRSGFDYEFLEMNHDSTYNGKPNPIANANVRLALALALDKQGLIQSALGLSAKDAKGLEAWAPWVNTPTLSMQFANKAINGQWDPEVKKYVQPGSAAAVRDAKKLLDSTPYKGGFSVDFFTTSGNPVRQAQEAVIAADWNKIGVKVNPNYVPSTKLFGDWNSGGILQHGAFQVAMHGYSTSPEPDGNRSTLTTPFIDRRATNHSLSNANASGISDKLIDREMGVAEHSISSSVRRNAYYAVQVEMDKLAHWIMLYWRPVIVTYRHVSPVYDNPTLCSVTCNIYSWKATTS
jgi:ABC-type transport system substrate-binding protein